MFTKKKPLQIKKQTVTVPAKSSPNSSLSGRSFNNPLPNVRPSASSTQSRPQSKSSGKRVPPETSTATKRKRSSKSEHVPDFGTSDDDAEEEDDKGRERDIKKRKQREVRSLYRERCMRSQTAFSSVAERLPLVHAADIPSRDPGTHYEPYFLGLGDKYMVHLQYPSLCSRESYQLVRAPHDSQGYDPINDIAETMHKVIEFYIPKSEQAILENESTGFTQRLYRAVKKRSQHDIEVVIEEWNTTLYERCQNGSILTAIDDMLRPDPRLVEFIINQTHARTVSLNLKALHEYEAGTDNVYGELLPKFVSKILEDTMLGPDAVFVDLGSGVGNVVLQAALEAGCESWGCEMMEKYCDVADLQHKEFTARCQLWGLFVGDIHLERGDFLSNPQIHETLRRADVVLVNNQVFTPQTNDALTTLFLDLKDGCRVVSLKSFVPAGHRINIRNSQSPYSILGNIKEREYFSKSVSWTDQGGKYFISTKDQSYLTKYNANGL